MNVIVTMGKIYQITSRSVTKKGSTFWIPVEDCIWQTNLSVLS